MKKEPPKSVEHMFDDIDISLSNRALVRGIYYQHLEHWLKYFRLDQFLFLESDRFSTEPWAVMEEVEDFLGLEHELIQSRFEFNATKGFYCFHRLNKKKPSCLSEHKGRAHPVLPKELEVELKEFYQPWNKKFEELLGKKFNWE